VTGVRSDVILGFNSSDEVRGFDTLVSVTNGSAGSIAELTGLNVEVRNPTAPATRAYGARIQNLSGGATVNKYGVKIENIAGALVSNYALHTDGGLNHLGDTLELDGSLRLPIHAVNSNYTITDWDKRYTILGTAGGSGIQVDLPLAANNPGRVVVVKKVDATVAAVTVAASGGDTVDGAASQAVASQWDRLTFQSDGVSQWFVIS
jgi:hypothetical protein